MADTTTTTYGLTKPEVGASEDTWGTKINTNLDTVDSTLKAISDVAGITANTAEASIDASADYINVYDTSAGAVRKALISNVVPASFASGTVMLFAQTAAPTGWTKSTTHNDKALRVVSGTASSGGSSAFTTAFGTPSVSGTVGISGDPAVGNLAVSVSGNIGNTTLSVNQIPSHKHGINKANQQGSSGNFIESSAFVTVGYSQPAISNNTGGGGSHNHSHNLSGTVNGAPSAGNLSGSLSSATASIDVQYVDVIIATKD